MSTLSPAGCEAAVPPPKPVIGLKPWFPWPLSRWRWLTAPVRAERLAALRIGIALVMLVDVCTTYLPRSTDYLSRDGLGSRELFEWHLKDEDRWAILRHNDNPETVRLAMLAWAASAFLLLIGLGSRVSAVAAWALSGSVAALNYHVDNAGDLIRTLALFYLMLSPCGAAWSVDAWLRRRLRWSRGRGGREEPGLHRRVPPWPGPFFVHPWPLCLLFVQMMLIYTCNGLYKASGKTWHEGTSLYYVLGDLTLARFSYALLPLPLWLTKLMTWSVLFAPVMLVPWQTLADRVARVKWLGLHHLHVLLRWNRALFLIFGALFHLGILLMMELGGFGLYMLCLYLPLVPWERWRGRPDPAADPSGIQEPGQGRPPLASAASEVGD